MDLLTRIQNDLRANDLLARGDRVLVALSGGPDSVALLHLLHRLRESWRLELAAVYVNHGLRPEAARAEEAFCEKLCAKLGIPLTIERANVKAIATEQGIGIEEAGRNARYTIFETLADSLECDRIALGHHADDQVETILFRVLRGTGGDGLTGIPAKRGRIIRPLLGCTKDELLAYLRGHRLRYRDDASNRSLRYRRNVVRRKILPVAREQVNPAVNTAVIALADNLRADNAFLEEQVSAAWRKWVRQTPGGKLNLAIGGLRTYHEAIRRRLLRRCVIVTWGQRQAPDKDMIARLDRLVQEGRGRISLPDGLFGEVAGERLWIYRDHDRIGPQPLPDRKWVQLPWPLLTVRSRIEHKPALVDPKGRRLARFDAARVDGQVIVRGIKPGDRFRPLGMSGTKKVGDLLTDRKIARPVRGEIPLACDNKGILWVVGVEIADRAKLTASTEKVLTIEYRVRKGYRYPAV